MKDIVLYTATDDRTRIEVRFEDETVWLTMNQISELFGRDKSVISRHLRNIFREGELEEEATVAKIATVQNEAGRNVLRNIEYYNLDAIISVGYRVNSLRGTQFRIWATKILKNKLLDSIQKNHSEKELTKFVRYMNRITEGKALDKEEATGLLKILSEYTFALDILDKYDHQQLEVIPSSAKSKKVSVTEVRKLITSMKAKFGSGGLFGMEKDKSLESSVSAIYQTFNGKELYPSPEIKAANLLYFMVKNHSFIDGNKRIAAAVFIYFLHKNNILTDGSGLKIIDNNTLVALTLMIAESNPKDREMLMNVVVNLTQQR